APKTPKVIILSNNYCIQCEQKDKYIEKLESLVNNTQNFDKSSNVGAADLDYSSNQINHELFEGVGMQLQNQFATPTITLTTIQTEMPLEMQNQMGPTTILTHTYEPEDFAITLDLSPFNVPKQY
ncbi:10273_t:CDS:2, partial [Funneliformis mosseae]